MISPVAEKSMRDAGVAMDSGFSEEGKGEGAGSGGLPTQITEAFAVDKTKSH